MRKFLLLLVFINVLLASCTQKSKQTRSDMTTKVITISKTVEEDAPSPPPLPGTVSPYHSIEEWLTAISKSKAPNDSIETYHFELSQGENEYILSITGEYFVQDHSSRYNSYADFGTELSYFTLPQKTYAHLPMEEVQQRVSKDLQAFAKTPQFKSSFLSKAKQFKTDWDNKTCTY